ncbi:MAG: class I SAM-dependent methyltransferase [Acidimicrobiales bacterium]
MVTSDDDPQHYFEAAPTSRSDRSTVELVLPDLNLTLATDSGVFGRRKVDPGTKLLLLDGPAPSDGDHNLLDIGAGYGPIALTLAARNPEATVWAVEVNSRARELCRDNAATAGLTNVRVVEPDSVPPTVTFDRIWSNPPIRIGKAALQGLLERWLSRLTDGGTAHLVVQKHLGSDSLHRWLDNRGFATTRRASRAGYRLLDVAARVEPSGSAAAPSTTEERS